MLELKVLVLEFGTVDGLAASAIALGKVAALDHELLDHTVEDGALVVKRLSGLAHALLTGTEGAKVLGRLGHYVIEELERDAPSMLVAYVDVEEDAAAALLGFLRTGHCGLVCAVFAA